MSIEFKNVSKKLGNNIVINNVNIEIKKGIVTGLKGAYRKLCRIKNGEAKLSASPVFSFIP